MNIMENSTATMYQYENQTILDQWNSEFVSALWSDTLLMVLYIVIGVVGNSLVIMVYTLRFRNKSEERFFIPYLAVIDIVACLVCSSFGISVNQYAVTFTNDGACKAFWFFSLFTTGCSIFTLLVIAVQRYQKICRPFEPQMSLRRKRLSLLGCIAASILLSLPAPVFYGISPVKHPDYNIMGTRCANIRGPWSKAIAVAYKGLILLVCLGVLISLIVLYSLIGRTVFKRMKFNKKRQMQTPVPTVSTTVSTTASTIISASDNSTVSSESIHEDGRKLTPKAPRPKTIPGYRLSMMFMLITAVFVLCFIPKLAMMVFESRNEMFWLTLDTSGYGAYRFFYTMYIINSIVNPVIYGFFDKTFRQELASLC